MPTYDSIDGIIERVLDILSPDTNTEGSAKTLQQHVIQMGICVKGLNGFIRVLDDRVKSLEAEQEQ